jgi:hypothetical protein
MNTKQTDGASPNAAPTFAEIKAIMDHLVTGKEDLVPLHHGDHLKWTTAQELRCAVVQRDLGGTLKTYRLIEPELVGQPGRGHETLLVRVLSAGFSLDGKDYPQMPKNGNIFGQHATPAERDRIAQWIEAGCPD